MRASIWERSLGFGAGARPHVVGDHRHPCVSSGLPLEAVTPQRCGDHTRHLDHCLSHVTTVTARRVCHVADR
jgi:hypothetical protein